jgi:hypothetical protein
VSERTSTGHVDLDGDDDALPRGWRRQKMLGQSQIAQMQRGRTSEMRGTGLEVVQVI